MKGHVVNQGSLLWANELSLRDMINAFGGFKNEADKTFIQGLIPDIIDNGNIQITEQNFDFTKIDHQEKIIKPGSILRVGKVENEYLHGFVEISGEVYHPGKYRILDNDTIFNILKRSGGLLEDAYLEGFVLSRENEKEREKNLFLSLKKKLIEPLQVLLKTNLLVVN